MKISLEFHLGDIDLSDTCRPPAYRLVDWPQFLFCFFGFIFVWSIQGRRTTMLHDPECFITAHTQRRREANCFSRYITQTRSPLYSWPIFCPSPRPSFMNPHILSRSCVFIVCWLRADSLRYSDHPISFPSFSVAFAMIPRNFLPKKKKVHLEVVFQ